MHALMPLARCLALLLFVFPFFAHGADDLPLVPAVECNPRAGLPNFYAKLKAGGEVRIAYLGGSITAQEGWRPKTLTPGMPVRLTIHPLRDGTNGGQFVEITLPDGTIMGGTSVETAR